MIPVRALLLVVFVISFSADGECFGDTLKFLINEKIIVIQKSERELRITVSLANHSKVNLILYAFRKTMMLNSVADSIFFNDIIKNGGVGNALILLNKHGTREKINREVCFDCGKDYPESRNPDYLAIAKESVKNIYVTTCEVANARKAKIVTLSISLEGINLKRGEYKICLLYYCGSEINDFVDQKKVAIDEAKFKAHMLRGWVKSDTVKLIVK